MYIKKTDIWFSIQKKKKTVDISKNKNKNKKKHTLWDIIPLQKERRPKVLRVVQ